MTRTLIFGNDECARCGQRHPIGFNCELPELIPGPMNIDVPCRFGCPGATGIYYAPHGCICWTDPVQALCEHHAMRARDNGVELTLIARPFGVRHQLPPLEYPELHTPEVIASLQKRAMKLGDDD